MGFNQNCDEFSSHFVSYKDWNLLRVKRLSLQKILQEQKRGITNFRDLSAKIVRYTSLKLGSTNENVTLNS